MAGGELVGKEELDSIEEVFKRGGGNLYRYGPNAYAVGEFEKQFAEKLGVKFACAVSSGTAAIHTALAAVGVKPGDEVISQAFTFVAPVEAIVSLGAVPILVDIDETYHLDPQEVQKKITSRTKAVVTIPMWAPPKMDELLDICERNAVILVEDSAQNLGVAMAIAILEPLVR